jgi:glucose-6-phosphate 1-epimerase
VINHERSSCVTRKDSKIWFSGETRTCVDTCVNDMHARNPWIDKAQKMSDFGDDEWRVMVCLEAANIAEPTKLQPGSDATFRHSITLRAAKM